MKRNIFLCCTLAVALLLGACSSMDDTQRRTATGAAVGGLAAGAISGEWGWAAGGAAIGALGGYLYDQHKKSEQNAYEQGKQDGQRNR